MKRSIFLAVLGSFLTVSLFAQFDVKTVAVVNLTRSEPIMGKQVRAEVERMEKATGRALTQEQRQEVLDAMINERLAIQAAERDRITITDNELNQQINQLKAQMVQALGRQPTDAEFAAAIRTETGLEMQAFRDQTRRQLIAQKYLMSKKQHVIESLKVPTDTDIVNAFNLTKSQFIRPDTIRFSLIQIPFGADAASRTKAKELADSLLKEIGANPAKFDEVVLRGQGPNSAYQAGDFGYLPRNMQAAQVVGQEFINTAFALQQGSVSKVIEGQTGYQIIKVTETYSMKSLELDDIFQLGTRVTVRDYIGNALLQERQMAVLSQASQELVNELRAGKTFQILEKNLVW